LLISSQTATGLGSTAARAASMLSPVVNLLEIYHFTIPTVVIGSLALASGIMAFLLPETRRTDLPDSTEAAEGLRYMYIHVSMQLVKIYYGEVLQTKLLLQFSHVLKSVYLLFNIQVTC